MSVLLFAVLAWSSPTDPALLNLQIFDVRDLFPGEGAEEPPGPDVEEFAQLVERHLLTSDGSDAQARAGSLVVRATMPELEALRDYLTSLRDGSIGTCGVVALVGDVDVGVWGDPTDGVRIGPIGEGISVTTSLGVGTPITLTLMPGDSVPEKLECARPTVLQGAPTRPLENVILDDAKTVRFIESYESVDGVVGHPKGFAIPKLKEVEEGVMLEGTYLRLPGTDRIRFWLTLESNSVERPVPVERTEHGPVHRPDIRTHRIETTVTFAFEQGFVLVVPTDDDGTEKLVSVWVNETPKR